jgi:hypothetical protein
MKEFFKKIFEWLFYPPVKETETHYYVELWSDDGWCGFWMEKDKNGEKDISV